MGRDVRQVHRRTEFQAADRPASAQKARAALATWGRLL